MDNDISYKEIKAIYYGKITEGKINGYGRKADFDSNIDFEGNFIKGEKKWTWKRIRKFKAGIWREFKDDKRNGYGKEYNENNNIIFEGQFLDGKRWEGFGKETNYKGIMFSGEYKNGKRNGEGKEYYCDSNSIKYSGNY